MSESSSSYESSAPPVVDEQRRPWEAPELTVIDVSQQTQGADPYVGGETFGYTPS